MVNGGVGDWVVNEVKRRLRVISGGGKGEEGIDGSEFSGDG